MPLFTDQAHLVIPAATYVAVVLIAAVRDVLSLWIIASRVHKDNQKWITDTTMKKKDGTALGRFLRSLGQGPGAGGGNEPPAGV